MRILRPFSTQYQQVQPDRGQVLSINAGFYRDSLKQLRIHRGLPISWYTLTTED